MFSQFRLKFVTQCLVPLTSSQGGLWQCYNVHLLLSFPLGPVQFYLWVIFNLFGVVKIYIFWKTNSWLHHDTDFSHFIVNICLLWDGVLCISITLLCWQCCSYEFADKLVWFNLTGNSAPHSYSFTSPWQWDGRSIGKKVEFVGWDKSLIGRKMKGK